MKKVFKAIKNLFGKKSYCPCDRGEVTCVECYCEHNPSAPMCKVYDV